MTTNARAAILATVAGVAAGWLAAMALVWLYGDAPSAIAMELLRGTWAMPYGVGQVLYKATSLLLTGVAVDVALRAGLFNIGAEGQLAVAGLAVAALGAALPAEHARLASHARSRSPRRRIAGAAWAVVPAILRARFREHTRSSRPS